MAKEPVSGDLPYEKESPLKWKQQVDASSIVEPPFTTATELLHTIVTLPAYLPASGIKPQHQLLEYLDQDLRTTRLDEIYPHLWLAGLPKAARPLHRQQLLGRTVIITENPNEHLVWHETRIFIKPLPEYLLCHKFWALNTEIFTQDRSLRQCACGLLLSYCWLVCHKSDLIIAHATGLLPASVTWEKWTSFVADFLDNIDAESLRDVSIRYHYGDLRISRLNLIYRLTPSMFSVSRPLRGFMSESTWSKAFLGRNFAWLFPVFGVVSIALNAMQVGLGTKTLQANDHFQTVSLVFTAISMIAMAASVTLIATLWVFLFGYHVIWARRNLLVVQQRRETRVYS